MRSLTALDGKYPGVFVVSEDAFVQIGENLALMKFYDVDGGGLTMLLSKRDRLLLRKVCLFVDPSFCRSL